MQSNSAVSNPAALAAAPGGDGTSQSMMEPQPTHQHMPLPYDSAIAFYGRGHGANDNSVINTSLANPAPALMSYAHSISTTSAMSAQNLSTPPLLAHAAPQDHHQPPATQHQKHPVGGRDVQHAASTKAASAAEGGDAVGTVAPPPPIEEASNTSGDNSPTRDSAIAAKPMVQRNVYISGLSSRMRSNEFRELCQRFGRVEASKLCIEGPSNPSKGYGFVLFYTEEGAAACIAGLQGSYLHGRCLQARLADANATPAQARGQALSTLHPSLPRDSQNRRGPPVNRVPSTMDLSSMPICTPPLTGLLPGAAPAVPAPVMHSLPPGATLVLSTDQAAALQQAMQAQALPPPSYMLPITNPTPTAAPGASGMYYVYSPSIGGVPAQMGGIVAPQPAASMPLPAVANFMQTPSSIVMPVNLAGQPQVTSYAFDTAVAAQTSSIATPTHAAIPQGAPMFVYAALPPYQNALPGCTVMVTPPDQTFATGQAAPLQQMSPQPVQGFVSQAQAQGPEQYIIAPAAPQVPSPSYATVTTLLPGALLPPGVSAIYQPGYLA